MNKFSKINLLQIFILAFVINSCSYPEMVRNELVYENDFESLELNSIDGGDIMLFNNTFLSTYSVIIFKSYKLFISSILL